MKKTGVDNIGERKMKQEVALGGAQLMLYKNRVGNIGTRRKDIV